MARNQKNKDEDLPALGKALTALERPETIRKMIIGLGVFCLFLFIADFFHLRHGKFEAEHLFGFYGFAGFAAFTFIIFATKALKVILGRKEDYYAPNSVDGEDYPAGETDIREHGDV